jgi:ABC-type sugar transport system permease subunit
VAAAAAVLVAGCGNNGVSTSSGGVVQLTMLTGFTGSDEPSYQALISEFNKTHPDIHVTMTVEPWATVAQKLPESWATGEGPDLATPSSDPGSIFNYINTNSVLPLNSAVGTGASQIDSAAFPSTVRSAFTVKGNLYAVPANMATLVLYYNKDMFSAAGITSAPTTEDQFIADAKKLTLSSGGKVGQYGLSLADNNTIQMWPILQWMSGGDIVAANGCATVDSAASIAALSQWSQLVMRVTVIYTAAVTAGQVVLGLGIAARLRRTTWYTSLLRTAYFFPFVASLVVVGIIWKFLLDPQVGLIDGWLGDLGVSSPPDWLQSTALALPTLIGVGIWKNVGFTMIVLLAGMQQVPADLYEAATLDGAGPWHRFRAVTLPALRPALLFTSLIATVTGLQLFDLVFAMTGGGPVFSTESVVMYLYEKGFVEFDMGYASAIAWVLFVIILAVSAVQLRVARYRDDD